MRLNFNGEHRRVVFEQNLRCLRYKDIKSDSLDAIIYTT